MASQKSALEIYTYMENCNMSIYFDEVCLYGDPFGGVLSMVAQNYKLNAWEEIGKIMSQ